jgi:UDP-N-acetylglucosamine--N-acetylmuramyl-(pentapeptide) pyrophosphoryl-undecaprenol N-acetylglucosamine transferase
MAALPVILAEMQVIHVSGMLDWPEVEAAARSLPAELAAHYRAFPYLHEEMGAALSVANLALSRAGASSLGEYPFFGLPAILVPYPYAWRYQRTNAAYLADQGAAVVIEDAELPARLATVVKDLMHDPARRGQMRQAMLSLARPQAAGEIVRLVEQLLA